MGKTLYLNRFGISENLNGTYNIVKLRVEPFDPDFGYDEWEYVEIPGLVFRSKERAQYALDYLMSIADPATIPVITA